MNPWVDTPHRELSLEQTRKKRESKQPQSKWLFPCLAWGYGAAVDNEAHIMQFGFAFSQTVDSGNEKMSTFLGLFCR